MELDKYIACICEGNAEQAVMDLLLENDKLVFTTDMLLDDEIIRCRAASEFERRYLRTNPNKSITVLRILDSRREKFNLSNAYRDKIKVINVLTAPEIEMLIIISEDKYNDFKKKSIKPSEYCKSVLKYKSVKSYKFVYDYFSDIEKLMNSIIEYKRISKIKKGENTLLDLLK